MPSKQLPRGVRNNNPGNIDRTKTKWQGMAEDQSSDPRFVVFKAPVWGIRALARTLLTYQNAHHCGTVRKIIERWAPPNENNTSAYVKAVAAAIGVEPNDPIDVDGVEVMAPLVKAIIAHENGGYAYPEATVLEGLRLAGVADAKPKPLTSQVSFISQTGALAAGGLAICSQYAAPVKQAASQLADFTGAPIISHAYTVLLTIAGVLTLAGIVANWLKHKQS